MTNDVGVDTTKHLEQLIAQVRGVQAARIVLNSTSEIDEIHVVGSLERSPKAMVRDIESILYVRGGIRIDHRKISLVQVEDSVIAAPSRIQLVALNHTISGDQVTVSITLKLGEEQVVGVQQGQAEQEVSDINLAANATIQALNQIINSCSQLRLEQLQPYLFGSLHVILSQLSLVSDERLDTLLGISVTQNDELLPVARSILDAVNRHLPRIAKRSQLIRT